MKKLDKKIKQKNLKTTLVSDVNSVENDVKALIAKYRESGTAGNVSVFGDAKKTGDDGFFLIFIRRNEKDKKNRMSIYTLASEMSVNDIVESFARKIADIIDSSQERIGIA